jgi:hypothetical protein
MAPLILPCKCTEVIPKRVKTNMYKVQAKIEGCKIKGYCRLLHLGLTFPLEEQFYWNNCACNEYDGLMRRHFLGHLAGYQPGNPAMQSLENELITMSAEIPPFSRVDHKTLMKNTRASIKNRYKRAYSDWRTKVVNLGTKEARAKGFVKYEKIPIGKFESGKPPRMIQYRDFTFLYCLKRELLPFSLSVKNNSSLCWNGQSIQSIFTKTQDCYGTARVLRESWDDFDDPVAICLDHCKFDGHYCVELIDAEGRFWRRCNSSRMLKWLLEQQEVNIGVTPHGIFYTVVGSRLSGEWSTSDGNSTMNYGMLATWLKKNGVKKFRIHVNGDDSVIIVDRKDAWIASEENLKYFNNFNMETECGVVAEDFRDISYCQAQPIRVLKDGELKWYMVKEPRRTIARLQYCDEKFAVAYKRFARGVGLCELAVNSGIPITQNLAIWMISEGDRPLGCVDKYPALDSGNDIEIRDVHTVTRTDYEYAFNISVTEQLYIEQFFAGLIRSTPDLLQIIDRYKHFHRN